MEQHVNQQYEFGHFRLMPNERRLYRENESVALPPKEFDLLFLLVRNAGQPLSREELHRTLWPNSIVEEANLNVHISALRKALAEGSTEAQFIETLPRHGYRFVASVTAVELPHLIIKQGGTTKIDVVDPAAPEASPSEPEFNSVPSRLWQYARQSPNLWIVMLSLLAITLFGSLAGLYFYLFKSSSVESVPNTETPLVNTVPLTTYPGRETQSAFSPDGNQIAFAWSKEDVSNLDIYLRMVDGGNVIQLTNHPGDEMNPTWGPQGRSLAFYRSTNEGDGIFVIPALGGSERKLADLSMNRTGLGPHTWLHWSPTGKWLIVTDKTGNQEPLSLYLLSPETGVKRRLTKPPASVVGDCSPMFSPDGSQIAFVRLLSAVAGEVFIVPTEGGEPRQLTRSGEGISNLTWASDGREIIYSSRYSGKSSLFRIPAVGGRPQLLQFAGNEAQYPVYSEHGNRLVWARNTDNTDIFQVRLKDGKVTGTAHSLIASTAAETSPRFAPDGKQIAFVSNRSGSDEIWICGSGGENPTRLTSFQGPLAGSPAWSPDGKQIVFDCRPEGNADIFVISREGGQPSRLTTETAEDIVPSWSHDGRWIYFSSQRSGSLEVWKFPSSGGAAIQVTQQGGFEPVESPDGQWLYYARTRGSSAIWRVPVAGGAESFVFDFHQKNYSRLWTFSNQGILFATPATSTQTSLHIFASNQERSIAVLDCILRSGVSGLSLSPDENSLVFPVVPQRGSDLVMVEGFR